MRCALDLIRAAKRPLTNPERAETTTGTDHPITSHLAAFRVMPRSGTQRRRLLNLLVEAYPGGLTDEDFAERTGLSLNTIRPRRGELVRGGWAYATRERRKTQHDNDAIVWAITARGREELHNGATRAMSNQPTGVHQ
jgi:hypothetical protein